MDSFLAAVVGALVCGAILALAWLPEMRQLRRQNRQLLQQVVDLATRLASKNPEDYRAWTAPPFAPEAPFEPRLYDETGLLMVPLEDRLED